MKPQHTLLVLLAGSATLTSAASKIDESSISIVQRGNRDVVIEYTIVPDTGDTATEPVIVTCDILTNAVGGAAVSVGPEHLTTLSGDANCLVGTTADNKHKILWSPHKEDWPEFALPAAQLSAHLTVWATNEPPAYWVIDLTQPASRGADRYYADAAQIPGGITNDLYKTDRLVFRHIPAKGVTFREGNAASSYALYAYRYATLSYDYWLAVYELTKEQYNHIVPSGWAAVTIAAGAEKKPITWNPANWRGTANRWPANGHAAGYVIGGIRPRLGNLLFDAPTEAEWEFAALGGVATFWPTGDAETDLAKVAWYSGNAGNATHEVGLLAPNGYGLYDIFGNVNELCLDVFSRRTSDPVWDPVGPTVDESSTGWGGGYEKGVYTAKGGFYNHTPWNCRPGVGAGYLSSEGAGNLGCRLALPIE